MSTLAVERQKGRGWQALFVGQIIYIYNYIHTQYSLYVREILVVYILRCNVIYKYMYMTIGSIVQYTCMNAYIYIYVHILYCSWYFLNIVLCIVIMLFSSHSLLSQQLMIFGCCNQPGDQQFVKSSFWLLRSWWCSLSSYLFDMCSVSDDQLCN